ncbi:MAG TPA: adenylate kinase [Candidatus Hydrogenedentes bacterium]|nr:adenylate kinase [Candidatus Hydrogenedentota bacterium]HOL77756.1 adenylate kinase [Candidatus Hydrogenedentota bacterium]HPO86430.1 adenylate kinase [Candidatus Hydrogenedentota bacterium]
MGLRIIMLGAPGAGKGTQAQKLAAAYHLPQISTGDIFRKHLREGTELGKQVQGYLQSGALVPDELTCAIVADRLQAPDCANGYILDGFPRSQAQAESLDRLLQERNEKIDAVIEIDVPDAEIIERLSTRRSCPVCGAVYNLKFGPFPHEDEKCDRPNCGSHLVQRDDDREETIRERLKVYQQTTRPIREYYEKKGLLMSIPASRLGVEALFSKIEAMLAQAGASRSS